MSAGALILFVTNVIAMVTAGIIVFGLGQYRLMNTSTVDLNSRRVVSVVVASLLVLLIPLGAQTYRYITSTNTTQQVVRATQQWVAGTPWKVEDVTVSGSDVSIRILGQGPPPSLNALIAALDPGYTVRVEVQEGELLEAETN